MQAMFKLLESIAISDAQDVSEDMKETTMRGPERG